MRAIDLNGRLVDAEFSVAVIDREVTVLLESRGGRGRNPEYNRLLLLLLIRLADIGASIIDLTVESAQVTDLDETEKRLLIPGRPYPIMLRPDHDLEALRHAIGRAQEPVGQVKGAKGGNRTKRLRIAIAPDARLPTQSHWGRHLAEGDAETLYDPELPTYLLVWEPKKVVWEDRDEWVRLSEENKPHVWEWSGNHGASIAAGARAFLLQRGDGTDGIIGSGVVINVVRNAEHANLAAAQMNSFGLRFDALIDRDASPLNVQQLSMGPIAVVQWEQLSSGAQLPTEAASQLEDLWAAYRGAAPPAQGLEDDDLGATEGQTKKRLVTHRRRERRLRRMKIESFKAQHAGSLFCEVPGCHFDFERVYGALGKDYAQVHHLLPLAKMVGPATTTLQDLAVVCANCHAMIHVGGECRSLGDLVVEKAR